MNQRLLWFLVAGVALAMLTPTVCNKQSSGSNSTPPAATASASGADSSREGLAACRTEATPVEVSNATTTWRVSPCGAGLQSILLRDAQFHLPDRPVPPQVPTSAAWRYQAGPLDLLETWSPRWDALRVDLPELAPETPVAWHVKDAAGERTDTVDLRQKLEAGARFAVVRASPREVALVWPDPKTTRSPVYIERTYKAGDDAARRGHVLEASVRVWNLGAGTLRWKVREAIANWQRPDASSGGIFSGPPDTRGAGCLKGEELQHGDQPTLVKDGPKEARGDDTIGPAGPVVDSRYFMLTYLPLQGLRQGRCQARGHESGVVEASLATDDTQDLPGTKDSCVPEWYAAAWGGASCKADYERLGITEEMSDKVRAEKIKAARLEAAKDPAALAAIEEAARRVEAQRMKRYRGDLFAGPKDIGLLREVDPRLVHAIDFGWFGIIARPMLELLRFFHGLIPSWPVAILLLTLTVKLATLYWMQKNMISMRAMARLKPQIEALKTQYGDDATKLNQSTMALYKAHHVNPLAGCLPMLLQMPIWIALYRTIYSSVELYNVPLFGWIADMTQADPFFVLPILLGVVMIVQTRISPQSGDAMQAKIMQWVMPIMMTAFMLFLPAALTLYIFVNTLLGIGHQFAFNRWAKARGI